MSQVTESKAAELRTAWEELKKLKPAQRIRECAEELQVSEAELLATTVGDYTTKLEGDWTKLVSALPALGRVMSLTRNDSCVLEHKGPFQKIDIMGGGGHAMATVIGPIESRIFFNPWKFGFAVKQQTPKGLQQSLQFFDGAGTAITKIYLQEAGAGNRTASNQEAYDKLVAEFKASEQSQEIETSPVQKMPAKPINEVDATALLTDWENMKDTHDFFGMLRKHKVNRFDAVVLAEGKFAYKLDKVAIQTMLEKAATDHLPIMIFAGNHGNLQIHQGKVQTIRVMDNWLNVLDPDFNMHLRADHVDTAWVITKPTSDGVVTSIEVFDRNQEMIVQFFGLRKPGIPELTTWRELVAQLPKLA
jgi:putative hemin transport protein